MDEKLIASVPLFASLEPEQVRRLAADFPLHEMTEGSLLIREGDSDRSVFILLDGQVEIIKAMGAAGERSLGNRAAGAVFGEMSLFSAEGRRTASVVARTPLRLMQIPIDDFNSLLHQYPSIILELLRTITRRLESSENATIIDLLEKNRQLARAYQELQAAQEQIIIKEKLEHELELARKIQHSILPHELPQLPGYEIAARMIPARAVGGDFYDFIPLGQDRLGIVIGDVADKGMPAALVMSLAYSLIQAEGMRSQQTVGTLELVNSHLIRMDIMNTFVTALFGILNPASGEIQYSRAGHPPPILLDSDGRAVKVPFDVGRPLGLFEPLWLDQQTITLPSGGLLLLYSDGLSEASRGEDQQLGASGILGVLTSHPDDTPDACCQRLLDYVAQFSDQPAYTDDITLVAIRRLKG